MNIARIAACFTCFAVTAMIGGCSNEGNMGKDKTKASDPAVTITTPANPVTPVDTGVLASAHRAYLDGDFIAVGERVRDVLLDRDSNDLVKQNAYELLDKAFEAHNGSLPSSFKPPAGVTGLQLAYRRFMSPHGPIYQIRFAGQMKDAAHLTGLTVRRLPDETLMDKASGKGKFSVRHDPGSQSLGTEEFVIDSPIMDTLLGDGVISLRLELDDGTVSEGFVIAHALAPSASPEVLSPTTSSSVSDANPLIKWTPFRSPEYMPFEGRRTVIHVTRDGEDASMWEAATPKGEEISEVRVGAHGNPKNASLTPGNYWVSVGTSEFRSFGPVELLRASRISLPFNVVR